MLEHQIPFSDTGADETVAAMKTTPGLLYFLQGEAITNNEPAFIQFFDLAVGDVVLGTTAPTIAFMIPSGDGTKRGDQVFPFNPPLRFNIAITYAVTTTATGSTGPAADINIAAGYR